MCLYLDEIFLVLPPRPDDDQDVENERATDGREHGDGLDEVLQAEHRAEVYHVGRHREVTTERRQMVAQALGSVHCRGIANLQSKGTVSGMFLSCFLPICPSLLAFYRNSFSRNELPN